MSRQTGGETIAARVAQLFETHRRPDGRRWTTREVAAAVGCSHTHIAEIANGRVADPQTGNLPIRVLLDNPRGLLTIGQSIRLSIVVEERKAVLQVPTAAILDLGLPGRSGLAVLEQLRAAPATARLPVLVLSARDGQERARVEALGAEYMKKPFEVDALAARVGALVAGGAR